MCFSCQMKKYQDVLYIVNLKHVHRVCRPKTFTSRMETPFSCRGHSVVTFDERTLKFVVRFERHVSHQNVAQREMHLLTNPNNPAVAKHVNTALRHVIRSSVCKHASKACDSADDKLRSRQTANQKTGVCELGGASLKRCGTFYSLGNTTLCN